MIRLYFFITVLFAPSLFAQELWTESTALEALTPIWASPRASIPTEKQSVMPLTQQKEGASSFLLGLLVHGEAENPDACLLRLRGAMSPRLASELITALSAAPKRADRGVDLLLTSDWRACYDASIALILDVNQDAEARVRIAQHVLLAAGRPALERIKPLFDELDALDDTLFFRILSSWQTFAKVEDAPFFERLAASSDSWKRSRVRALQAYHEIDPTKRLELFEEFWSGDPDSVEVGLMALAQRGEHAGISARLRDSLGKQGPNRAQIALRYFSIFASSPDALFHAWKDNVPAAASANRQNPWMRALVLTPSTKAKQAVAEWLLKDGWRSSSLARSLFQAISKTPAFENQLDAFLLRDDVPLKLRIDAALSGVKLSSGARHFLKGVVESGSFSTQRRAMLALSRFADSETISLFIQVFQSPRYANELRALAIHALASHSQTRTLLLGFLEDDYANWEVANALIESAIRLEDADLLHAAELAISEGIGCTEADDRAALERTRWEVLAELDLSPEMAPILGIELQQELLAAKGAEFLTAREWNSTYPSIRSCMQAYRQAIRKLNVRPANDFLLECEKIDSAPLYFAARMIADSDRQLCGVWCEELLARELQPREELLVLGLQYRVSYAQNAVAVLDKLRGEKAHLWEAEPFGLRWAFPGQGESWVLVNDRLAERQCLARAESLGGPDSILALLPLLQGYATPEILMEVAELAARTKQPVRGLCAEDARQQAISVALRFAQRAEGFHPYRVEIRERVAEWAVELGQEDTAAEARRAIHRLSPH